MICMSNMDTPKAQQTAYERWEMSSFPDDMSHSRSLKSKPEKSPLESSALSKILEGARKEAYEKIKQDRWNWYLKMGINEKNLRWKQHDNLVFYASDAWDIEYDYPSYGFDEMEGVHDRTDYDLTQHSKFSGVDLSYKDPQTGEKYIPWILETSVGLGRMFLAFMSDAYTQDKVGDDTRTVLKLSPELAPIKIAVFPLLKNKSELVAKAREVYDMLKAKVRCEFDDNGNIGKRYRRQDEIGTPKCVVIDFETLENDTVTVRDRDTTEQVRVQISDL
ncbi:hypothetical protein HGB25_02725 [Candidatus Saccharibacteria bacterium]|nr:hypothetical protein [Candidatus Saccharibacteria bacterium]